MERYYEALEGLPEELRDKLGLRTDLSSDEEARMMGLPNVSSGLLVKKAGIFRPERVVEWYYELCKGEGVEFKFGEEVESLLVEPSSPLGIPGEPFPWQEKRVAGVRLSTGEELKAEKTVLAAGAKSFMLTDAIGIDCHTKPKKRQVFVINAGDSPMEELLFGGDLTGEGSMPFVILPNGAYVRPSPEDRSFWVGYADELGRPFSYEKDPQPERNFFFYGIYPVLAKYFPQFEGVEPINAWAGHYEICTLDELPVAFEEADLIFSGGLIGIFKADAMGRVVSALYSGRAFAELFGGEKIYVGNVGINERVREEERLVI